ncbi:MAG: hypothetical protein ACSHX8_11720 [Opitutaceae bacterium]
MLYSRKTALPLTLLLCASITGVHAYEQNGYVIFELVQKVTSETTQANLLPIESKLFDSTEDDSSSSTGITLTKSEFLMDTTLPKPKSSTFSDPSVISDTVLKKPDTTSSFGEPSTSAFGEPSSSAFGEPKKSAFGE